GSETASISPQVKPDTADQPLISPAQAEISRSASSAEYLVSRIKSHKKSVGAGALVLLLAIGGIGFALYKFWGKSDKSPRAIKIERLTTNGKSHDAAISPDGKYVVYVLNEGGQRSLWTRQVATTSNVQIIPPADVQCLGLGLPTEKQLLVLSPPAALETTGKSSKCKSGMER